MTRTKGVKTAPLAAISVVLTWMSLLGSRPVLASGPENETRPRAAEPMVLGYPHADMRSTEVGRGPRSYWLFEPTRPKPVGRVPLIVFNHGWMAMNPAFYGAWIRHLARQGCVVIFPKYQTDMTTPTAHFLPNALWALRDAMDALETGRGRVRPDRSRFALIGHSAGGNLAAQIAAVAAEVGLPEPRGVMAVVPGEVLPSNEPSLARIPSQCLLVVIAAEEDLVVGDRRAREIFRQSTAVPLDRKEYIFLRSDRYGNPPLIADHLAPTGALGHLDTGEGPLRLTQLGRATVDPIDTAQLWRLGDAMLDAAFQEQSLDDSAAFQRALRDPGRWSDGRPLRGPLYGDNLSAFPRVVPGNGLRLIPWPNLPSPPDLVLGFGR